MQRNGTLREDDRTSSSNTRPNSDMQLMALVQSREKNKTQSVAAPRHATSPPTRVAPLWVKKRMMINPMALNV